jgi:hypothetical protein
VPPGKCLDSTFIGSRPFPNRFQFISYLSSGHSTLYIRATVRSSRSSCKYMLLHRHQSAGQNRDIKTANRCSENVAQFRYLGTTVTNQNSSQEEIKKRLNLVQKFSSSRLLSKNIKIRISIYLSIYLSVCLSAYLSIHLSIYLSIYSCCSHLEHGASMRRLFHFSF